MERPPDSIRTKSAWRRCWSERLTIPARTRFSRAITPGIRPLVFCLVPYGRSTGTRTGRRAPSRCITRTTPAALGSRASPVRSFFELSLAQTWGPPRHDPYWRARRASRKRVRAFRTVPPFSFRGRFGVPLWLLHPASPQSQWRAPRAAFTIVRVLGKRGKVEFF